MCFSLMFLPRPSKKYEAYFYVSVFPVLILKNIDLPVGSFSL